MARVSDRIPVTFDAAENDPIRTRPVVGRPSARSSIARSIRPSASSLIVTTSPIDSRHGQLVAVVLVRSDEDERPLARRDVRAQRVAVVEIVRDPQVEDVDELVDGRRRSRAAEDDGVVVGSPDGVADDPARLLAEARRLQPRSRRLGVRVGVQRQDGVAQVVLDERQGPAGRRVVGVRDAADPERPGDRLVVADDRCADQLDEVVLVRSGCSRGASYSPRSRRAARGPANGYPRRMRIATWNVNSLKARQEAVENWLARAAPDILLIQETKLTDADAPVMSFAMAGYQLVHHGEGRWNGVAIAARDGLAVSDVVTNFGDGPVRDSGPGGAGAEVTGEDDFDPFDEARMVAATVDGLRVVSLYAPNGRIVGLAVLRGQARLVRAAGALGRRSEDGRGPGPRRRSQRGPDRGRRLGRGGRARRHARLRAGASRLSRAARTSAWSTATGPSIRSAVASRGGTTGPACSTRTSGCGSTTCWSRRPSPHGSSTRRSIATPARGRRSRPTTRRS